MVLPSLPITTQNSPSSTNSFKPRDQIEKFNLHAHFLLHSTMKKKNNCAKSTKKMVDSCRNMTKTVHNLFNCNVGTKSHIKLLSKNREKTRHKWCDRQLVSINNNNNNNESWCNEWKRGKQFAKISHFVSFRQTFVQCHKLRLLFIYLFIYIKPSHHECVCVCVYWHKCLILFAL